MNRYIKQFPGTFAAICILAVLGLYLLLFENDDAKNKPPESTNVIQDVESLDRADYIELLYRSQGIVLEREAATWWLVEDDNRKRADSTSVENLINEIKKMRVHKTSTENKVDTDLYGLDNPVVIITLRSRGSEYVFYVGNEAPASNSRYVQSADTTDIMVIDERYLAPLIDITSKDLQ